jgi:uncharacterized protein with HEPN domain
MAVLRNLGIIGEAGHRLLAEAPVFADEHPELPLAKIYAMRNRITHAYEEVDLEILWTLIQSDAHDLMAKVAAALSTFRAGK